MAVFVFIAAAIFSTPRNASRPPACLGHCCCRRPQPCLSGLPAAFHSAHTLRSGWGRLPASPLHPPVSRQQRRQPELRISPGQAKNRSSLPLSRNTLLRSSLPAAESRTLPCLMTSHPQLHTTSCRRCLRPLFPLLPPLLLLLLLLLLW